ncbi:MAG: alpha/beta hydrolase [Burkholderiaceae bacterium]|jgi:3-oxoadipate enol-lactonase|nr:alpha/beta hydrolase [Burkholderiaceae bacterium]
MYLKFDDADLMVGTYGNGPRTLVGHGGWVGSGELWSGPFEILSRSWRTVAIDHRGSGASRHRAPRITFEALTSDLLRVLDALSIESCVLAGESMGALVVLEAALRWPDRVDGLVIVDGRSSGDRTPASERLVAGCRADFGATMKAFVDACVPEEDCAAERSWGELIVNRSDAASAVQMLECVEGLDVESRLASLAVPTLILHGSRDAIVPLACAEQLAARIRGSRLAVADGAGHVPTVTRPRWVAEQIEAFFG